VRFVHKKNAKKGPMKHLSKKYGFPVVTRQEVEIAFPKLENARFFDDKIEVDYKEI
jgi:hypothetical protein